MAQVDVKGSQTFGLFGKNEVVPNQSDCYKIYVKSGDKPKAGTDASVYIVLHGEGQKSEEMKLDATFGIDFKRGQVDTFTMSNQKYSKVCKLELWKDNVSPAWTKSDWHIDTITIENEKTKELTVFPIFRWIRPEYHYMFVPNDTTLRKNDPHKEQRLRDLEEKRKLYQFQSVKPGIPAQIKTIHPDEKFSYDYQWDLTKKATLLATTSKMKKLTPGDWNSIEDIRSIYTNEIFHTPSDMDRWKDDVKFGMQRLAGMNNNVIRLCTKIPEKFGVTENMILPFLEGMSLLSAFEKKRLFIIDYDILENCPTKEGFTICAPMALFFQRGNGNLVPIAIQLRQYKADDNPVFLPSDPAYTWILAKLWFNVADAQVHQAITHLGFTHLIMESLTVITHRNMSQSHPLFKLLAPHFLYLISINSMGLQKLASPGGMLDKCFSVGSEGILELVRRRNRTWRLDVDGTLPENLRSRGVDDLTILPEYYFREDALMIYNAIKTYVTKYLDIYYKTNKDILDDEEVQNWREEMVKAETNGGLGVKGVPGENGKFATKEQLTTVLTAVIYTCSVEHAAANLKQYDEYAFPPNYPTQLRGMPPKDKAVRTEQDILTSIVDKPTHYDMLIVAKILSEKTGKSLGDFEVNYLFDPRAKTVQEEFQRELTNIGLLIRKKNEARLMPYTVLDPREIPNSISI